MNTRDVKQGLQEKWISVLGTAEEVHDRNEEERCEPAQLR
jgi:hypothetical protein